MGGAAYSQDGDYGDEDDEDLKGFIANDDEEY